MIEQVSSRQVQIRSTVTRPYEVGIEETAAAAAAAAAAATTSTAVRDGVPDVDSGVISNSKCRRHRQRK